MRYRIKGRIVNKCPEPVMLSECLKQRHKLARNKIYRITVNKLDMYINSIKRFNTSTGPIFSIDGDSIAFQKDCMEYMWRLDRYGGRLYTRGSIDADFEYYKHTSSNYLCDSLRICMRDIQGRYQDVMINPDEIVSYDIIFYSMALTNKQIEAMNKI